MRERDAASGVGLPAVGPAAPLTEPNSPPTEPGSGAGEDFVGAFRSALTARRVSLKSLERRLATLGTPVSLAALSYWRSGRSQPERESSIHALTNTEDILGLAPGALTSLLGPPRRVGARSTRALHELMDQPKELREALAAIGLPLTMNAVEQSAHVVICVNDDRQITSMSYRSAWQALVEGTDRLPSVLQVDAAEDVPRYRAIAGCQFGRQSHDLDQGIFVTEIVLPRALRRGESAMVEYELLVAPDSSPDYYYQHFASARLRELSLWLQCSRGAVPRRVERFCINARIDLATSLDLVGHTVHTSERDFGPGVLGLRWFYD